MGALLGFLFAARFPAQTRKLVMVAAPAFTAADAARIRPLQEGRLGAKARAQLAQLAAVLESDADRSVRDQALADLARLLQPAEIFERAADIEDEPVIAQHDIYTAVWREALRLRGDGDLLAHGRAIDCPVLLLHGDYDPRPAAAISAALAGVVRDFRAVILPRCGHLPWLERHARSVFFDHLRRALD